MGYKHEGERQFIDSTAIHVTTGLAFTAMCFFSQFSQLYIITYLLTPWSRVLLEKLTSKSAASQEIPLIYGTRKSLTVPTSARHLSLS